MYLFLIHKAVIKPCRPVSKLLKAQCFFFLAGFWKASCPPSCTSPLLVFVNSKSGDSQGVKFLRRFKQLLNPAQVFDLMNGGPHLGSGTVLHLLLFMERETGRF